MRLLPHIGLCLASLASSGSAAITFAQERDYVNAKVPLGKIVAFGDSLSDNGTGAWTVSNHTWPRNEAYFGHRFSNGPVWVEVLAERLGMELVDNAVGGATSNNSVVQGATGPNSSIPVPSAVDQVAKYFNTHKVGPGDIFVIMIGANDALFKLSVDDVTPAVSSIIKSLYEKGGEKFLVVSYPNLGRLPLRAFSNNATSDTLEKLSFTLQRSLLNLRYQFCRGTDIQVGFVDVYSLFLKMMLTPIDYGMDPGTIAKSCLVGAYSEAPSALCNDPDKYIFWDEYHPTRVVHRYIGALAWKASQLLCNNQLDSDE
ncbi:GDSL lipase/esterase [Gautieria morchelliformis]|nr:GDSL lipase/esterase [Gautieria morchelliformis]